MVLTVSFALSLVSRACCHHRLQDVSLTSFISASGYQDHTTSPSALAAPVLRRQSVHRIPRPTFVTIAKRPSDGCGMAGIGNAASSKRRSEIFFAEGLDTSGKSLPCAVVSSPHERQRHAGISEQGPRISLRSSGLRRLICWRKVACGAAQRSKQGQGTNEMGVSCLARSIFNTELASDGER